MHESKITGSRVIRCTASASPAASVLIEVGEGGTLTFVKAIGDGGLEPCL